MCNNSATSQSRVCRPRPPYRVLEIWSEGKLDSVWSWSLNRFTSKPIVFRCRYFGHEIRHAIPSSDGWSVKMLWCSRRWPKRGGVVQRVKRPQSSIIPMTLNFEADAGYLILSIPSYILLTYLLRTLRENR